MKWFEESAEPGGGCNSFVRSEEVQYLLCLNLFEDGRFPMKRNPHFTHPAHQSEATEFDGRGHFWLHTIRGEEETPKTYAF